MVGICGSACIEPSSSADPRRKRDIGRSIVTIFPPAKSKKGRETLPFRVGRGLLLGFLLVILLLVVLLRFGLLAVLLLLRSDGIDAGRGKRCRYDDADPFLHSLPLYDCFEIRPPPGLVCFGTLL